MLHLINGQKLCVRIQKQDPRAQLQNSGESKGFIVTQEVPKNSNKNKVQHKVAAEQETKIGFRKTENHSYAGKKDDQSTNKLTTMLELQTRTKDDTNINNAYFD